MNYAKPEWRDGQPYSLEFDDVYFSFAHGVEETEHVFIHHNQLLTRFAALSTKCKSFVIAETGFGSGLNFLITVKHWLELSRDNQCLFFYSAENTPFTVDDLKKAQHAWPELQKIACELQKVYQVASYGFHVFDLFGGRVKLILMIGDVQTMLLQLQAEVDAWYLDGFAPGCNPDMWSENVFLQIQRLSRKNTTFSTYTAAGFVRRGLISIGFDVEKVSGIGKKRHMLTGTMMLPVVKVFKNALPWYDAKPSCDTTNKQVTIIGGGMAGISTAWALIKRGFKVHVIEAGHEVGFQASGNPQAMLMPRLSLQDSADAEFYTSAYFYALRCLQHLDPQQTCWSQTGGLQLASSERIKKQINNYPQTQALAKVLEPQDASELSGFTIDSQAHYFPLAACLYPHQLLQCMIGDMGQALCITYNTRITSIEYEHEQWCLFDQSGDLVQQATCLVLANAWQAKRFKILDHVHCQPARGQLSYYQPNEKSGKLKMPLSFDGYLLPVYNNQQVSGASFELDDCDTGLRDEDNESNLQALNQWFDDVFNKNDIIGGRASVRAVTSDRMPVVGPVSCYLQMSNDYSDLHKGKPAFKYPVAESLAGCFVNIGHGARGFTSAFLTSELVAAMICNEPLPVSNRVRYALHSSRFLIRSLKKKR